MKNTKPNRRSFVKNISGVLSLSMLSTVAQGTASDNFVAQSILCVGGHPDDPESGCGGTLAKFANAGHKVSIIYLTTGDAGIEGKSLSEAAAIRKQEAISACKILNVRPLFAGQVDGDTVVNNEWLKKLKELIEMVKPDIVFTHWPLDSHKDHQVASLLTTQVWWRTATPFSLYFFEVVTGMQSMGFHPTDLVDISDTQEQKRKALYCHTSQHPAAIYQKGHASMEIFRGLELGVKAAEGFVRMIGKTQGGLAI